jgi:hypothetical protein
MVRLWLILICSAVAAEAVPQNSARAELQGLIRLPRVEFAQPLSFDRSAGFIVFPDASTASSESLKILGESKFAPADAPKYLQAGRHLQANREFSAALRAFGRAADLYRKRVESQSEDVESLAGLAESLGAIGRSAEGVVHMEKALALGETNQSVIAAGVRVFQNRAWQVFGGEGRFSSHRPFIELLRNAAARPPEPGKIEEARRALDRAGELLGRLRETSENTHLQRAAAHSFQAAMSEALQQKISGDKRADELSEGLFAAAALDELDKAAELSKNPAVLAAAMFAKARAEHGSERIERAWPFLSPGTQRQIREICARLENLAADGSENSAAAAEYLGAAQLVLLRDPEGAQRSFRVALEAESKRNRSWELSVLAASQAGAAQLLEVCQARFDAQPTARASVLLARAYDGAGDRSRAELICIAALTVHPNDFLLNLTLAAILLKRENAPDFFWRVRDLIAKAEKQFADGQASQKAFDLALTKGIYLALSDKPAEARAALTPFASNPSAPPEVGEVLRVLER